MLQRQLVLIPALAHSCSGVPCKAPSLSVSTIPSDQAGSVGLWSQPIPSGCHGLLWQSHPHVCRCAQNTCGHRLLSGLLHVLDMSENQRRARPCRLEEVSLGRSGPRSSRQETHVKQVGEAGAMLSDSRRLFRAKLDGDRRSREMG